MNQRTGREERTSECEAKGRVSAAAKSESNCGQTVVNDRTNVYHKGNKSRESNYNSRNASQRRPQYCPPHRPYRSHRSHQSHQSSDWTLRPDHVQRWPRPRESYPRQRPDRTANELVERTQRLSLSSGDSNRQPSDSKRVSQTSHESKATKEPKTKAESIVDEDLQQKLDELTALRSIFDESVLTVDDKELKGRFLAEPVLNANKLIVCYKLFDQKRRQNYRNDWRYDNRKDNANCDTTQTKEFVVQHLPPIEIYFELSADYPSKVNPSFLISCKWLTLSQLDRICQKLEDLYYETRMEVLFTWFSFLQNDVLTFLNIEDKLDITVIVNYQRHDRIGQQNYVAKPRKYRGYSRFDKRMTSDMISSELIEHLQNYNEFKEKETFKKSYFSCNICFTHNPGEDCVVFPCKHINCKSCIRGYFETLIKEGTVNLMKCPDTECQTKAPPNMIRELVSEDLYKQYDKLMLDTLVGTLSDAHYCPRKACGTLVIADADSSLAHCTACGFAFCKNCKHTYHGFDPCNMFRDPEQRKVILEKYQNAIGPEKQQLEKIYGKKQLQSALEEMATEKWLDEVSKRCPHCKASIEKSDGCNKMSCWRCNTFFCWLCLKQLPLTQPYTHFNDPMSNCYNQLFRGVHINMEDMFEDDFD